MYEAIDFSHLLGIRGLSDGLLLNHFALYKGYVENSNKILKLLEECRIHTELNKIECSEVHRRLGWEFNSMRLHEFFFSNLTKEHKVLDKDMDLYVQIEDNFGSFEAWKQDFLQTGLTRGIGWVVLYLDLESWRLVNIWIDEHNINHIAGGVPLLVMDVWEHAYIADYELKKEEYIRNFFDIVNWYIVSARYSEVLVEEIDKEMT